MKRGETAYWPDPVKFEHTRSIHLPISNRRFAIGYEQFRGSIASDKHRLECTPRPRKTNYKYECTVSAAMRLSLNGVIDGWASIDDLWFRKEKVNNLGMVTVLVEIILQSLKIILFNICRRFEE